MYCEPYSRVEESYSEGTDLKYHEILGITHVDAIEGLNVKVTRSVSATHTEGWKNSVEVNASGRVGLADIKGSFSHDWDSSDSTTTVEEIEYDIPAGAWIRAYQTREYKEWIGTETDVTVRRAVEGVHCTEAEAKKHLSNLRDYTDTTGEFEIYDILEEAFGYNVVKANTP